MSSLAHAEPLSPLTLSQEAELGGQHQLHSPASLTIRWTWPMGSIRESSRTDLIGIVSHGRESPERDFELLLALGNLLALLRTHSGPALIKHTNP